MALDQRDWTLLLSFKVRHSLTAFSLQRVGRDRCDACT